MSYNKNWEIVAVILLYIVLILYLLYIIATFLGINILWRWHFCQPSEAKTQENKWGLASSTERIL